VLASSPGARGIYRRAARLPFARERPALSRLLALMHARPAAPTSFAGSNGRAVNGDFPPKMPGNPLTAERLPL
jgi:hypothetical protein